MKRKTWKDLRPLQKSMVDPTGQEKRFIPGFIERSRSVIHKKLLIPVDKPWSGGTLTNLTVTGTTIGLTTPGTTGTFTSQALLQTDFTEEMKTDIEKVQLNFTHTLNGGTVQYFLSNDGGAHFPVQVLVDDAVYKLPGTGDEFDNFQSKFNDLRIRIVLNGSISPTVSKVLIKYK